jgi:hypothetical protein
VVAISSNLSTCSIRYKATKKKGDKEIYRGKNDSLAPAQAGQALRALPPRAPRGKKKSEMKIIL